VDEFRGFSFDVVITVCDSAREACPIFPGDNKKIHHSFDDPPYLSRDTQKEEVSLSHYRRVRDEIRDFIIGLPDLL
jgi:arsenate reductase